jgi:transposase
VRLLRREAKTAVIAEGRRHEAVELLRTIPQLGPVRAAQIVATADTPHRFRTKRQFWAYSGLGVVTHASAEYLIDQDQVVRRRKPAATRGLNRNCNRRLKSVFIAAATAGVHTELYRDYLESLQQRGMRREMARLTLARKIATLALTLWKGETFDPEKVNWTM